MKNKNYVNGNVYVGYENKLGISHYFVRNLANLDSVIFTFDQLKTLSKLIEKITHD